jgi:peptide/nickel transport system substrate-binding protein
MLAYDPAATQASYDPEAARQLLAKVGYDTNRPIRFVYNSGAAFGAELAHALQRDLQAVGLRVELIGKTNFRDLVEAAQKRDGDLFFYAWHVSAPYPERILKPLFHSGGAGRTNLTRYANPRVDRQLDEAMRLPAGPKQAALYAEVQRSIVDDAPMVFLYHATRMAVVSTRVRGLSLRLDVMPADKLQRVGLAP